MGRVFQRVSNGDPNKEFTAVPATVAVPVLIFLISSLGAMGTWTIATVSERTKIAESISHEFDNHSQIDIIRFNELDRRIDKLETGLKEAERDRNSNTARLSALERAIR